MRNRKLHVALLALLIVAALLLGCADLGWNDADRPTYSYAGSVSSPTGETMAWDLSVTPQTIDVYDASGMCIKTRSGSISLADLERAIERFEGGDEQWLSQK